MNLNLGLMPRRIWIETLDTVGPDACDVIVEMENGAYYTALFVTLPYLRRQMELNYQVSQQFPDTPVVRYVAMETTHILVEKLDRDTIEDTVDNLLSLDTFETTFTRVLDDELEEDLETAEVAAVVLTEVLKAEDATVV